MTAIAQAPPRSGRPLARRFPSLAPRTTIRDSPASLQTGPREACHARAQRRGHKRSCSIGFCRGPASTQVADLIYRQITPCRVFNSSAAIPADQSRTFQVAGSGDLRPQGGPDGGCGVPPYAIAVSVSLSAATADAPGFFTAYAHGTPKPSIVSLRYRAGESATTGAVVGLSAAGELSVYASKPARAIGDVTGYYARPIRAFVNADATFEKSTGRIISVVSTSTGIYEITFDTDVSACNLIAMAVASSINVGGSLDGDKARITTRHTTSSTNLRDAAFSLAVDC